MRVNFASNVPFAKKIDTMEKPVQVAQNVSKPDGKLSYMDIPKLAFSGNIIKRKADEQLKLDKLGAIPIIIGDDNRFNLQKAELPTVKETQMYVNPQDPLVTKPELWTFHTVKPFKPGPAGERVKIVDWSNKLAEANSRGNFIYPENTPQFDQVHTFGIVNRTFDMYQDLLGRKINWGFPLTKQLSVFPHAGYMMNAYYSRNDRAIKLFEFRRPDTGKMVKTCQSSDIVSHETGHATLDGIKPMFLENFGFGVAGYHEAFADTTAMLLAMQSDSLVNTMLKMTGGDLKKENIVACLAEEFGDAIHKNDRNPDNDNMQYLRNAINFFEQKPYRDMPYVDRENDDTVLGLESHSYSRLYLGANYDILVGLYEKMKKTDTFEDQKQALMQARDIFAKNCARALDFSPAGEVDFKDMALATLKADIIDNKGENRDIIQKVFIDRKILTPEDIVALDKEMTTLPELTLPSQLTTPADIAQFVNENKAALGIPQDVNLRPIEAYVNEKDEKHVVLGYDNHVVLAGPQFGRYQGQAVNVLGSLNLTFNKDNKLVAKTFKEITPQVKEDVLYAIELMIQYMMAQAEKNQPPQDPDDMTGLHKFQMPELLISKPSQLGNFTEVVKQPMLVDPVDPNKRGTKALGDYFKTLQAQMQK